MVRLPRPPFIVSRIAEGGREAADGGGKFSNGTVVGEVGGLFHRLLLLPPPPPPSCACSCSNRGRNGVQNVSCSISTSSTVRMVTNREEESPEDDWKIFERVGAVFST